MRFISNGLCFEAVLTRSTKGLFYVIDGILDISLPPDHETRSNGVREEWQQKSFTKPRSTATTPGALGNKQRTSRRGSNTSYSDRTSSKKPANEGRRYLFTVNPGGIAGYLGSYFIYDS